MGKILLVGDRADTLRLTERIAREHGHRVTTVKDSQEALTRAVALPHDLVILDLDQPGVDGLGMCAQLKAHEATRHMSILMMTGSQTSLSDVRRMLAYRAEYVMKPFTAELLRSSISRLLRR